MKTQLFVLSLLTILGSPAAHAFPADGCEQERKEFPANWNDTSEDLKLFTCQGHYIHAFKVSYHKDDNGKIQLSAGPQGVDSTLYRAIITVPQLRDVQAGKASIELWSEKSCYIRGNLSDSAALVIDKTGGPDEHAGFLAHEGEIDYFNVCE